MLWIHVLSSNNLYVYMLPKRLSSTGRNYLALQGCCSSGGKRNVLKSCWDCTELDSFICCPKRLACHERKTRNLNLNVCLSFFHCKVKVPL